MNNKIKNINKIIKNKGTMKNFMKITNKKNWNEIDKNKGTIKINDKNLNK